jgi:hypothetical protein
MGATMTKDDDVNILKLPNINVKIDYDIMILQTLQAILIEIRDLKEAIKGR